MANKRKKSSSASKQQQQQQPAKKIKTEQISKEEEESLIGGILYPDELETTVETLSLLSAHPEVLAEKQLRSLRIALHDCVGGSKSGSLSNKVSAALTEGRYVDARVHLAEMRIRDQLPKLGSLQRWTRECDAVLRPDMTKEEECDVWSTLDAILRTTQPLLSRSSDEGTREPGSRLEWFPPFDIPSTVEKRQDVSSIVSRAKEAMKVLQVTPGEERRPPNKYPATIFYSPEGTFPLAPLSETKCTRHDIQGVPQGFTISSVFSSSECDALVETMEAVGLQPDEPVSGSAVQLSSVLAHNLIWLSDPKFIETLFERIKPHLPQTMGGGEVKGVNKRFRFYRYRPGALYRPHIDGAWPASALSTTSPPSYIYDSDPTLYSRLTLLIYLNDDFEGGATTFFIPSREEGVMQARPVKPAKGSVCVFPHGASAGSLLHEGSGVKEGGTKYVIRTEVLYEIDPKERGGGDALAKETVPVLSGAS